MNVEMLKRFFDENHMGSKGALCVGLTVTREAIEHGLPLEFDSLLTENRGQVRILGKAPVQKILGDYGIVRVLAEEGGRTNRGNMGLAEKYLELLNGLKSGKDELVEIEGWWIDRVRDFFAGKPLVMKFDPSKSIRSIVRDLIDVAEKRQTQNRGGQVVGTVLQHLVGAKLSLVIPKAEMPQMHGAYVADAVSDRGGDFSYGDAVIHVTSAPGEAVIRKCAKNIDDGYHPIIITTCKRVTVAEGLAESAGIANRLEVWDIEQFLSMNLNEHGLFCQAGRKDMASRLINAYNAIIDTCETDPSLKIEIGMR
ncbi:MAG: DUF4928 family protein [Kiritimatiellae bacterium]|nr:DUF4928 family protein [Kiritimatiellia bacterium]MBQ3344707.1 DUF4928 family protein [Kiritimatiellia bacterium]MBQ6329298.1 DUF4928 family protein [Kiritimatiellia bacterium]